MKETLKFYKIRDLNTGLFSTGGLNPNWTKKGKVWNNIGHVKASLVGFNKMGKGGRKGTEISIPRNWEVVEYTYSQTANKNIPIEEVVLAAGLF